MEVSGIK